MTSELEKLYASASFQQGRRFFHYGNYPYLFAFLTEDERTAQDPNHENSNEVLVAACLSYDLDDHYHLIYDKTKKSYFIRNGAANMSSAERLLQPVKAAHSLAELLGTEDFAERLIDRSDEDYHAYMENAFNQYEEHIAETPVPGSIFPAIDMRLYFTEKYPDGYITDHKVYNTKRLKSFSERVGLDKFFDIETFIIDSDHERFLMLVKKANEAMGAVKFLYVEFYQSAYKGIICVEELKEGVLSEFLKLGLIYNKEDVPETIYNKLS